MTSANHHVPADQARIRYRVEDSRAPVDGSRLREHLIARGLLTPAEVVAARPPAVAHADLGVPRLALRGDEDPRKDNRRWHHEPDAIIARDDARGH